MVVPWKRKPVFNNIFSGTIGGECGKCLNWQDPFRVDGFGDNWGEAAF